MVILWGRKKVCMIAVVLALSSLRLMVPAFFLFREQLLFIFQPVSSLSTEAKHNNVTLGRDTPTCLDCEN